MSSRSISPRQFVIGSAIAHTIALVLRFSYLWLDDVVRNEHGTFLTRLLEEATGALGAGLLSWFVYLAWCRAPLRTPHVVKRLPFYLLLGCAVSLAHTTFMWASRVLLFPVAGLGAYDYGRMPLRYLMEAPGHFVGFITLLGALALVDEVVARREHATARLELEKALVESQLRTLRLQLQPHFLFNALNTIAAEVYESPVRADRLLGQLSDLLRASLRTADDARVSLREELALLDAYAELMRARFGPRFKLSVSAPPDVHQVLVPSLLLQPLVENAIRHGGLDQVGEVRVSVAIEREAKALAIRVNDDGPGSAPGIDVLATGTGLSTTARRLQLMYGRDATLAAGNAAAGGFAVSVTLPLT